MERNPKKHRPSPTGEYFGLFVRGNGESRDGSLRVTDTLILHGPLYVTEAMRSDLETEAKRMKIRGISAQVRRVKRGETIVAREIPEDCITAIVVE